MITQAKTEEIKVRVDPLSKSALIQIASQEQLDLSDIVRRALHELIRKSQTTGPSHRQNPRHVR